MKEFLKVVQYDHPDIWEVWRKLAARALTVWVGGGVRNCFLGLPPSDIDLATSLKPDEIVELAQQEGWRADLVGVSFGVVVIRNGEEQIEVATFRTEGYGEDPHRPEWVEFGVSLEEDLARRDFTINGMALTIEGKLIDPFDGAGDIEKKVIRAIGKAEERFAEDALRMLRAIRFAARFGFQISPETRNEICRLAPTVASLSEERVVEEIEKILLSSHPESGWDLLDQLGLGKSIFPKYWKEGVATSGLAHLPADRVLRWAFLGWTLSPEVLHLKGLDKKLIQEASWLAHEGTIRWEGLNTLQRWSKMNLFPDLSSLIRGVSMWKKFRHGILGVDFSLLEQLETIRAFRNIPFYPVQLKIDGNQVREIVGEGRQVGEAIEALLLQIQQGQLINEEEELLTYLKKRRNRSE